MRVIALVVLMLWGFFAVGQSVLESHIIGMDSSEVYTMKIRNLDNLQIVQQYKLVNEVSRVTLYGGDYRITYYCNDEVMPHVEHVHISGNDIGVIQKFIFRDPPMLKDVDFGQFKLLTPEDFPQDPYMEF